MLVIGRRQAVLLSAAAAVAAGVALPHGGHDTASARPAPAGASPLSAHPWSWSLRVDGGDTIQVRSRHCPKSHPRKVGSFSYRSTRITNGKVEHHSATGSICAK